MGKSSDADDATSAAERRPTADCTSRSDEKRSVAAGEGEGGGDAGAVGGSEGESERSSANRVEKRQDQPRARSRQSTNAGTSGRSSFSSHLEVSASLAPWVNGRRPAWAWA